MSMHRLTALMMLTALAIQPADAQASRGALSRGAIAITNVNVVPMTRDTVIRDATVIVRDGRIVAVDATRSTRVPAGAIHIAGRGKYLIPGFADAHTHLYSDDELPDSLASYELGVMLANGVTAARLMIGTPEHLKLRDDVATGRILGPQLWLASPMLTGRAGAPNSRTVTTPDEARSAVREVADAKYDFIKIVDPLTPPVYEAIVDEARARGIRVDGHVDPAVGVARALEVKQNIQHLDGWFEAALADSAPTRTSLTQGGVFRLANWRTIDHLDDTKLARLGGATARAGIWSTPTLTVFNTAFAIGFTDEELHGRPDWKLMPGNFRRLYLQARQRYWSPAADSIRTAERRRQYVAFRNRAVKAIADSGGAGRILAGSDSPDWFMVYGWTMHRELQSLVAAGLTPYEALAAATRNPAEYFGGIREWGTIEVGKRADLVLLDANPLEDIRNTTHIAGVAIGGRWLPKSELERMIQAASERINDR
jgi:imidazolonepropionase-like amidohydrolase